MQGTLPPTAGVPWLLRPKLFAKLARAKKDQGRVFKAIVLGIVGLFFWGVIFGVIWRMLLYFRNTQGVGDLLAGKLLGLALLVFMGILLLSNVITSLSTFFLAQDLELLMASPTESLKVYGARLVETIVNSSWMVARLAVERSKGRTRPWVWSCWFNSASTIPGSTLTDLFETSSSRMFLMYFEKSIWTPAPMD